MVYYQEANCQTEKKKQLVPYRQCQGHSEGLYNQNMTISTTSSKLLVRLQPNSVWEYNIISRSVLRKNWITALKVKVTPKVKNVSEYLSGVIFWTTKHFVTKLGMVVYHYEANCRAEKNWFTIVNVKVTVRAYIIKIWLFLLYLPNCWSVCNQT